MRPSALPIMAAGEPWFNPGLATEANIMEHMPNTPALMENTIVADPIWWADNGAEAADRFAAWMAK